MKLFCENVLRLWRFYELVADGPTSGLYRMRRRELRWWDGSAGGVRRELVWMARRVTAAPGGHHLSGTTGWFPADLYLPPGQTAERAYRLLGFAEGWRRWWAHRARTRELRREQRATLQRYYGDPDR